MIRKSFLGAAGTLLFCLCTAPLFGQAVFSVSSAQPDAANNGATELTGDIILVVTSGTSVAGSLTIQYSAQITNNSASEILITGTGGLASISAAPLLDRAGNTIVITVPAGGTPGNEIMIQGVRVALAGLNLTGVTASITGAAAGNQITAGQTALALIARIVPPFSVDLSGLPPLSFVNGTAITDTATITINEGFRNAFTSSVGIFGQTVPTRFRIDPFPSIPAGVTLTFPSTVTSAATGAVLTTTSGTDETIPAADGSTSVIYEFTAAAGSPLALESFQVPVTMTVDRTAGTGTVAFQATLLPIGIATPNAAFPSTDIPRYAQLSLPDEADLVTGTTELTFPFLAQSAGTYTGIALTNPSGFRIKATLTAYDANGMVITGAGITNPVPLTIPRNGQFAKLASEIFGPDFNAASSGTIRVIGNTSVLPGFYLQGDVAGPRLDGAIGETSPLTNWVWPAVSRQNPGPFTRFELFNPGNLTATPTLTLRDAAGHLVATAGQFSVASHGTFIAEFSTLFSQVDLGGIAGGYVVGQSQVPLVARETFGNALDSNILSMTLPSSRETFYLAHFATGGGYSTEVNIINTHPTFTAKLTLTPLDDSGSALAGPLTVSIPPGAQMTRTIADLFPDLGTSLASGSVRVDEQAVPLGPFTVTPSLAGSLRFSAANGSSSAALPLIIPLANDFVYSHVAENNGFYTGIALLNSNQSSSASIVIEVFTEGGLSVGSYTTTLAPGQRFARLIDQLVPAAAGQLGGYIRIQSSVAVTSFSVFGSNDGLSLSAIPPQRISN